MIYTSTGAASGALKLCPKCSRKGRFYGRWTAASETLSYLCFPIITINPETAVSDFSLDITVDHMKKLDTDKVEDLSVRVIVTMAKKLQDVTINLQGPLLINFDKKLGLQFVIADGRYNTRHPLFGDRLKLDQKQQPEEEQQQVIAQAG